MSTKPKRPIILTPISEKEYRNGIAAQKNNKAAGRDDILVERLKHLGPKANKLLHIYIFFLQGIILLRKF